MEGLWKMKIPKKIHYCWFGNNEKPECILQCIESWKKFCPDYEIIEWNESNYDIDALEYTRQAYDAKKWAFVSDVARLKVVYDHGGIYMDTDVEILDNIDRYLENEMFMFFQCERTLASGLGFGGVKGQKDIGDMLEDYRDRQFIVNGKFDMSACPDLNTNVLRKNIPELLVNGETQIINGKAFYSCDEYKNVMYHYGAQSWTDNPNYNFEKKEWKNNAVKRFFRKYKRVNFLENHLPAKLFKGYIFFAYDFLDLGPIFYIKKVFKKIK